MNKILEAINNGINKSLIDFDDNGDFKKQKFTQRNGKKFSFGDYVYKDPKLGYNNYIGDKYAVCVSDEPNNGLYVILNHELLNNSLSFAKRNTRLYEDNLPKFGDGWSATQYILDKYCDELEGTIWEQLSPDEYIPSKDELLTIYNNCKGTSLWDDIGFVQDHYWSSSQYPNSYYYYGAFYVPFGSGYSGYYSKVNSCRSVALLHFDA